MILYGIKTCDTCKKARKWLEDNGIAYQFHDFRADGLTLAQLTTFASQLGAVNMLNKSSTSWRQLSEEQQTNLDENKAIQLMLALPTLIKRPLLDTGNDIIQGFKSDLYAQKLQ